MKNQLDVLRLLTSVVADTGDLEQIKKYRPEDATTNPTLILKAAALPQYQQLIEEAVAYGHTKSDDLSTQIKDAADKLAVSIGAEILKYIPGRVSTEVHAKLSYDIDGSIAKARKLIGLYEEIGIDKSRVLIKMAATWEGIKAAEALEKEGINCNLTLLFSFAQARACCEADVYLISPFVGRILDWYKENTGKAHYEADEDPGVISVSKIYQYYKSHGYNTVVMGASFRNKEQILALAGCDRLTIGPSLLEELAQSTEPFERRLDDNYILRSKPEPMTEEQFIEALRLDVMATEKLAEGIYNFAKDQQFLCDMVSSHLVADSVAS
ncbi:transaldolase [Aliiglaciecola sp.]|nr:transaldolase [Aliiglaciecola sp.]